MKNIKILYKEHKIAFIVASIGLLFQLITLILTVSFSEIGPALIGYAIGFAAGSILAWYIFYKIFVWVGKMFYKLTKKGD